MQGLTDMMRLVTMKGQDEVTTLFRLWHPRGTALAPSFRDTRWSQDRVLDMARRSNTTMSVENESDDYAYVSCYLL